MNYFRAYFTLDRFRAQDANSLISFGCYNDVGVVCGNRLSMEELRIYRIVTSFKTKEAIQGLKLDKMAGKNCISQ